MKEHPSSIHRNDYSIRPISKEEARRAILHWHYSHSWRRNFGRYCYGLYRRGEESSGPCLGIAAFGCMKTPAARIYESAIPGGWMCELNRFWVSEAAGSNSESHFLSACIRLLKREDPKIVAIQTFSDSRSGSGTIYQASNFQYYGYHHTTYLYNHRSGETLHIQNLTDASTPATLLRSNAALLAGDLTAFETKTHRYIYPLHPSYRYTGPGERQPYPPKERSIREIPYTINSARLAPRLTRALEQLLERYPHTREKKQAKRNAGWKENIETEWNTK